MGWMADEYAKIVRRLETAVITGKADCILEKRGIPVQPKNTCRRTNGTLD